jgi:hypothetical protein
MKRTPAGRDVRPTPTEPPVAEPRPPFDDSTTQAAPSLATTFTDSGR